MKRNILILIFTMLIMGFSNLTKGQSYAYSNPDPAPGNTPQDQALNTYWHYRYRLTHYFEVLGSKPGMSIPADIRNGADDGSDNPQIYWYDAGRELSYYLITLATEYRLLADYGQNTDETVKELYYAIHAAYRLDSIYMDNWVVRQGNTVSSLLFSNFFSNNYLTFPGVGIFQDNDVGLYAGLLYHHGILESDPLNAGIQTPIPAINPPIPSLSNDYSGGGANLAFGTVVCAFGSGQVGYVNLTNATDYTIAIESKDNFQALLLGLAMVVKLVDPSVYGFKDCQNPGGPYGYGTKGPYEMAYELGNALLTYIIDASGFILIYPDGTARSLSDPAYSKYWFGPYDTPLIAFASAFFNHNYLGPQLGIWNFTNLCTCFPNAGIANLEQPIEWAAMANIPIGIDPNMCLSMTSFGNNSNGDCDVSHPNDPTGITAGTGWDIYYSALNHVLWGSNAGACSPDFCAMRDMINCAPYHGPYSHSSATGSSYPYPDFAPGGWASGRRFGFNQDQDFNGQGGQEGNYSGLDYMMLFNLYYLLSEQNTPPVQLRAEYPRLGGFSFIGTTSNPLTVPSSCSSIYVQNLDVHNNLPYGIPGDLIIQTGTQNAIYLDPQAGDYIHIESGGDFRAYCPLTCTGSDCVADNSYYSFQEDPDPTNSNGSDARQSGSGNNPPYQKTAEFDTAYNANAFSNYPNPFFGNTTIDFTLNNSGNISMYIASSTGAIIAKLIDNESYSSGGHVINYNGSNLATGTYYCTLISNGSKKTIKIVKTK